MELEKCNRIYTPKDQCFITMLGTGNALATRCYNTCFTLHSSGGTVLMADAGGGNGVLTQLERAGMQCEDIHSTKERQFGFTALLPDGQRLCCLGDEPYNPLCEQYAECADWLMSEAFCLYEDRKRFQPCEKHHSTVLDAARLAETLHVKNLILYHTEDKTLETRKERYTSEAKTAFSGQVWAPGNLEIITLNAINAKEQALRRGAIRGE